MSQKKNCGSWLHSFHSALFSLIYSSVILSGMSQNWIHMKITWNDLLIFLIYLSLHITSILKCSRQRAQLLSHGCTPHSLYIYIYTYHGTYNAESTFYTLTVCSDPFLLKSDLLVNFTISFECKVSYCTYIYIYIYRMVFIMLFTHAISPKNIKVPASSQKKKCFWFVVSHLKHTLQRIQRWPLPSTWQISSSVHNCRRWRKSGRSCWKVKKIVSFENCSIVFNFIMKWNNFLNVSRSPIISLLHLQFHCTFLYIRIYVLSL